MTKTFDLQSSSNMLAFCHIEKAAGTTLIHILRRVFFLQYAAVRPMYSTSGHSFTARDLRMMKRCQPFLKAVGGHAVVPHVDLAESGREIQFITQLRNPVDRTISQYRYWISAMKKSTTPKEFLDDPTTRNFQTKKIAGCEDLSAAKRIIRDRFLLAGTVDTFDEFLVLLANRLGMPLELFTYQKQNVAQRTKSPTIPDDFFGHLERTNQMDYELFRWVGSELFNTYLAEYDGDFSSDLMRFRILLRAPPARRAVRTIDSIYRNVYIKPLTGIIRLGNGLPYKGSYAFRKSDRIGVGL